MNKKIYVPIKLISFIFALIVLLILTCVIYQHYKANNDTDYDYGDSAETITQNIYDAMNNFSEQKKYKYIYRFSLTGYELTFRSSYIIAVTKDQGLYILSGWQPPYSKFREEDPPDLQIQSVTYKKLSSTEIDDIIKEVKKACSVYKKQKVKETSDKYPPLWIIELKIYYGKNVYSYPSDIVYEPEAYYARYDNDPEFRPPVVTELTALTDHMQDINDEIVDNIGYGTGYKGDVYVYENHKGDGTTYGFK